ncbi:MAG: pyridoxal phosphate-dependent aminotransferase [Phycisphaerales bacterium]|nr:MAG: pyridoxal phosphate-dependent aminotransferase [Phycisphaerales bacterium]
MQVPRIEYMFWAKTRARVQYDLAASGVPLASPEDYGAQAEDLCAAEMGPYGHPKLIQALARRYGASEASVVPVPGASMGNYLALVAAIDRGDKLLVERPNYECLPRAAEFFGAAVEWFDRVESRRWAPDLHQVEDGLRGGARAVLLSNLHNPSGMRLTSDEVAALADMTGRAGASLIIDEVYLDYLHINRGGAPNTAASLAPHIIATSSLTKVYGLGGLRAGWLMASPEMAERVRRAMDHLMVNNSSVSMNLAIRALENMSALEARTRWMYEQGRPVVQTWLDARDDPGCSEDDGAVFVFINLGPGVDDWRLMERLVEQYSVAVVPGTFFGCPGHIRVSFTLPPDPLREALDRLGRAIDEARRS